MRLDAVSLQSRGTSSPLKRDGVLAPELIKQLSGGSVSGFLAGLLLSVFFRTLTLVVGVAIIGIQVASRYGVDVLELSRLKKQILSSRILSSLSHKPVFKLSFGVTFLLSAFVSF